MIRPRSKSASPGTTSLTEPPPRVVSRLWKKVTVREDGCWISGYSTASHGYAQLGWMEGKDRYLWLAHRVSWFATNGPIPPGMTIDHKCRVRTCVNPEHLRLMTNWDNARRNGQGDDDYPSDWGCKRNHDTRFRSKYTGVCLECHKLHAAKYRKKRRLASLIN